jgi:hypothetical protein
MRADRLLVSTEHTEEREGDRSSEPNLDAYCPDVDLDSGVGRKARRSEHVVDRAARSSGIEANIGAVTGPELGFVERRCPGERSCIGDVVEIPTSGEQPRPVDGEAGEREAEQHDADDEDRRLTPLAHGKLR